MDSISSHKVCRNIVIASTLETGAKHGADRESQTFGDTLRRGFSQIQERSSERPFRHGLPNQGFHICLGQMAQNGKQLVSDQCTGHLIDFGARSIQTRCVEGRMLASRNQKPIAVGRRMIWFLNRTGKATAKVTKNAENTELRRGLTYHAPTFRRRTSSFAA